MDNKKEKIKEPTFHDWYNFINSNVGKYLDKYYDDLIEDCKMVSAPVTIEDQIKATVTPHLRDMLIQLKEKPKDMLEYKREEENK